MKTRRKDCIHRDRNGGPCPHKQIRPDDAAREPANAEYCWEHRPVHPHDHDPACWSWPLPSPAAEADPWVVLADWQDGRCPICGHADSSEVLDHDGQTGLTRGWVCRSCNVREGVTRRPRSRYARWRACPATAMLGYLLPYGHGWDVTDGDLGKWTGFTFYPEGAPDAHLWPHALTCDVPAELGFSGPIAYSCGHAHVDLIHRAISAPMADGERLTLRRTQTSGGHAAAAAVERALSRERPA